MLVIYLLLLDIARWITGAGSLSCEIMILMGKTDLETDAKHLQQSMVLVPMSTPGITLLRPMLVMGDAEAPKGHMDILYGTYYCILIILT
jgi:alkylation response protein AidB-like acyl-CoA dehydrogenase